MRTKIANVLQLAGCGLLIAAAATVSLFLGLAVGAFVAVAVGYFIERGG